MFEERPEYKVYAYDKDGDVEVQLASLHSYEVAKVVAKAYLPLVKKEIIRRPEHTDTIDVHGEPFDWLFIEKPNGTREIIEF